MPNTTEFSEATSYAEYCALAQGTNIHPITLLATDYLNHFNEVIMLLEMIPDMPECMEDVDEWAPKSYADHFRDSAFSDKDLAVAAYAYVPDEYKGPFENVIELMNGLALSTIDSMRAAVDSEDRQAMEMVVGGVCRELRCAAETAGAIINGKPDTVDQHGIDELFA